MFLLGKDYRAGFPHSEGDPQRESPWPLLHQLTLFSAQSPQRLELSHRAKSCALKAHLSQDSLAPDCGLQNWGVDFSWFVCMFACLFLKFRNIDDIKLRLLHIKIWISIFFKSKTLTILSLHSG